MRFSQDPSPASPVSTLARRASSFATDPRGQMTSPAVHRLLLVFLVLDAAHGLAIRRTWDVTLVRGDDRGQESRHGDRAEDVRVAGEDLWARRLRPVAAAPQSSDVEGADDASREPTWGTSPAGYVPDLWQAGQCKSCRFLSLACYQECSLATQ